MDHAEYDRKSWVDSCGCNDPPLARARRHLEVASALIDDLLRQDLDEGGRAYLGALTDLVEVFEEKNVTIPGASESDVLRELMNANRLSQTRLAKEVRISQSTLSAVLNGTRSLTKAARRRAFPVLQRAGSRVPDRLTRMACLGATRRARGRKI